MELGEHEGEAFLVMEYVAGENAANLMKRCVASGAPLDPRLAAHVVAEICAGLHAAHELTSDDGRPQNLVHRDVTPQNLLVGYDGHVKLVDFGIALVAHHRDALTQPGEVKGKFEYMSPEQGLGKPLDRRSDIFSLGIVLYELSTGRRLFKRPSAARSIEAVCREPVLPPSRSLAPGAAPYPPKLEAIVMRALAKDPADRHATAAELRLELLEVTRELASPVEALADRMRTLFPDRIAEKDELLRKVGAGEGLSHVPTGDTDLHVEVPVAPEVAVTHADPGRAARRWRAAAVLVAAVLALLVGTAVIVLVVARPRATPVPAPPSGEPPVSRVTLDASIDEVFLHLETKPPGARVLIGGEDRGETPLDVLVARGAAPLTLELRRQGYVTATQQLVPDADQKIFVGLTPVIVHGRPAARPGRPAHPTATGSAVPGFRRFD
jgi:serine/threonine-protein kinase